MRRNLIVLLALAATPVARAQDAPDPGEIEKEISGALGKNDAAGFKTAVTRAVEVYGRVGEKKGSGLISATAKGLTNKEADIGIAAAEGLAKMPSKASAKALAPMLKVPPKPDGNRLPVHKAAIAACGTLAQPDSLKDLEKLLGHKDAEIAVAGAEALGGFKSLDKKKLDGLVGRLVKTLGGVEKKAEKLKGKEGGPEAEKVQAALNAALAKLTGQTHSTSKDWTEWMKGAKKKSEEE